MRREKNPEERHGGGIKGGKAEEKTVNRMQRSNSEDKRGKLWGRKKKKKRKEN